MPTTLTSSLFETKYRDDFRDSDHYHRILFNGGKVLQSRELTQLQTIIQKEVERFGQNIFKEGAAVLGGGITLDNRYEFIKLDTSVNTLPGAAQLPQLVSTIITGSTSGVQAEILEVVTASGSDPATLYVRYTSTSSGTPGAAPIRFTAGENLTNSVKLLTVQTTNSATNPAVGAGTQANVNSGVFFTQGHFVKSDKQSKIVAKYDNKPSLKIGFKVTQTVYTEDDDQRLYDNSTNTPNLTAPGAHRYRIDMVLALESEVDSDEIFVFYANTQNGKVTEVVSADDSYNKIESHAATRIKEINGDFIKKPFTISYEDHPTDSSKFNLVVSDGLAYINGYRVEKIGSTTIAVNKAQSTQQLENDVVSLGIGNYVLTDSSLGVPNVAEFEQYNLKDDFQGGGTTIGTARVKSIEEDNSNYRYYLMDISMNAGKNFKDARSLHVDATNYASFILENENGTLKDAGNNNLLFPFKNERVSALTSVSYTVLLRDTKTSDGSGNASLTTLTGSDAYTDTNDWIIARTDTGAIISPTISITNGGLDAAFSGLPASTAVEILFKKQIANATARTKTITNATVTAAVTTPATGAPYIDLAKADIIDVERARMVDSDGNDVIGRFILDNGQRDNFYKPGRFILKGNQTAPSGNIFVRFNYYAHGASGDFFGPTSYPAPYGDIPTYKTSQGVNLDLRDHIDFRSRFNDAGTNFTGSTARYNALATNTSLVTADVTYYLPRYDKLILKNPLQYLEGTSSFTPQFPQTPANTLELYQIQMGAGSINESDMSVTQIKAKGFTMKDISQIEDRLENLEEVTTLSLLETDLKNFSVLDSSGLDRTKSGFLVDNFVNHLSSETANIEYRASIDPQAKILRPEFSEESVTLVYDSNASTNIIQKGDNLYLRYDTQSYIEQPLASGAENVNPFAVITNQGYMTVSPSSDNWKDTKVVATKVINGGTKLDTRSRRLYGNWGWNWGGVRVGQNLTGSSTGREGNFNVTRVTRVVSEQTIRQTVGDRVLDVAMIPFIRSRRVFFKAEGLRPSTRHYAFFDGVDVNSWVDGNASFGRHGAISSPDFGNRYNRATVHPDTSSASDRELTSDASGKVEGSFFIPNTTAIRFRTGNRKFELMDVTGGDATAALSSSNTLYSAKGVLESVERTVRSTREISIASVVTGRSRIQPPPSDGEDDNQNPEPNPNDPLAQSFFIDKANGVFVPQVDVFFQTKDPTIPVQLQIRPMIAGVPDSIPVPGAVKFMYPGDVTTSTDATSATTFVFDEPIFLEPYTTYAIVLLAQSVKYNAYIAETEQFELGSTARKIARQPSLGSLFLSQNGSTWNPAQNKDMMFKVYQCKFRDTSGTIKMTNAPLPLELLERDPFEMDSGSNVVSVFHEAHGLIEGDEVNISGLDSSESFGGGIDGADLNARHTITAVDEDNYQFEIDSATAGLIFGGTTALATKNIPYEAIFPSIQMMIPGNTDVTVDAKMTSGLSHAGTETAYDLDNAYSRLAPNEINYLNVPKLVASTDREDDQMSGSKSLDIQLNVTTTDSDLTPVVDMQRTSAWLFHNKIDFQDSAGSSGVLIDNNRNVPVKFADETDPNGGSHFAKHIVKPVILENAANGIKILLSANKPSKADFDVYYKVADQEDDFDQIDWTEINPEENVRSDDNPGIFRDYTYLVGGTKGFGTTFDKFILKIVMKSTNSALVPTFKDLRVIALAV